MAEVYFEDQVTEDHSLAEKKKRGIAKLKLATGNSASKKHKGITKNKEKRDT